MLACWHIYARWSWWRWFIHLSSLPARKLSGNIWAKPSLNKLKEIFLSCRKLRSQANLLWSSLHYLDHLLENIPNNLVSFVCIEYLSIAQKFPQPLNKNCRLRRCPAHRFGCRRVSEFPSSSALMVLNFTASGTQGSWKGWCCSAGTYTGHQCKQPNHGTGLQHLL